MKKSFEKATSIVSWGIFFVVFFVFVIFTCIQGKYYLNSDISSQLILGHDLYEQGHILSNDWYYGNELYILNAQLIYQILFIFLSDWQLVRIIGTIILFTLLLLTLYALCSKYETVDYGFPLMALPLIVPLSKQYVDNAIVGLFYIPYIIIIFFTLNYFLGENKRKKRDNIALLMLCVIISFCAGVSSLRQILILYFPLCLTYVFLFIFMKKEHMRRNLYESIFLLGVSFLGHIYTKTFLIKKISVNTFSNIKLTNNFGRIFDVIEGALENYGFVSNGTILNLIGNILAINIYIYIFVIICYHIIKKFKELNDEKLVAVLFYVISMIILAALFCLTDMAFAPRYLIPTLAIGSIIVGVGDFLGVKGMLINSLMFLMLIAATIVSYINLFSHDYTIGQIKLCDFLCEEEYFEGYSTYWNSNNLTEYSNGKIEMRVWSFGGDDITDVNIAVKYFQKESHQNTAPSGKLFCLFSQGEHYTIKENMNEKYKIYEDDAYIVYGYDSYEILLQDLND